VLRNGRIFTGDRARPHEPRPNGTRWFFDHAETVSPRALERISALGGAVSIQNRTMFQSQPFIDRYGPAVAENSPPIRAMLDAGLTVAAGSDATRAASYNPWLSLSWLVTGLTNADGDPIPNQLKSTM